MILPIRAYGDPVLRKKGKPIDPDFPHLNDLIDSMFTTMYKASGVGLAAPQIGKAIRLFVVDSVGLYEDEEKNKAVKEVFINAQIVDESGNEWGFEEGCLSIPKIREEVIRNEDITITYMDRDFKAQKKTFKGLNARVIQHEYDHIEGILFTDHIKPLKKRMLKSKLEAISKGKVAVDYKMKFPK